MSDFMKVSFLFKISSSLFFLQMISKFTSKTLLSHLDKVEVSFTAK